MALFQKSVLKKHLNNLDVEKVDQAFKKIKGKISLRKIFRFINQTKDTLEHKENNKKYNSICDFDFKICVTELKKQKTTLSLIHQVKWQDYFNTYKTEINHLQTQITQTDQEIDQMVYDLYGLTDEVIEIVEGS